MANTGVLTTAYIDTVLGTDDVDHGDAVGAGAYATLNYALTQQERDITSESDVTFYCVGTTADTAALDLAGWTSSSTYKPIIIGNNDTGAWSTDHYRLEVNAVEVIDIPPTVSAIEIHNLQVANTRTSQGTVVRGISIYSGNYYGRHLIFKNNIVKFTTQDLDHNTGAGIFVNAEGTVQIYNNIIYGLANNSTEARALKGIECGRDAEVYNNTIYNCDRGIVSSTDTSTVIKNNVVIGSGDWSDFEFTDATEDYNVSSDTTATGANSITGATAIANFTDAANGDFTIKNTSADIYHAGVDVGLSTDITGYNWATPPSIGVFEYVATSGPFPVFYYV